MTWKAWEGAALPQSEIAAQEDAMWRELGQQVAACMWDELPVGVAIPVESPQKGAQFLPLQSTLLH